ncbi:MAG: HNH endonuclease [Actinomycetota bacterium]|nr:HNH endonuclease [Actinomycetota bacterium]
MSSKHDKDHRFGSPLPHLARAITAGAVRLAAATAAWLLLVAEFDERGGWHGVGINSCAHWLAWQCGMAPVTAREHVRVARALRGLPMIRAAFGAGQLSYAKVRALTRIAAPDCEAALLEFAMSATASQTERFCRAWRRVDDEDLRGERRPEDGRSFEHWTDDEGYLTLKVRMRIEEGTPLLSRIDSLAEREARRERAQNKKARARHEEIRVAGGQVDRAVAERCLEDEAAGLARERTAARRIAALAALAEARVTMDRRPGDPPRREVVVHVDADVLADDTAAGRAHFEGGPAITGAQARRMLCEATALVMLEKGREPLAVGRRKRRATHAQRRALLRRDGGCARPGCPETRPERLHAHHMRHWLFGGRTELANLVLLCDADHGLVHDHGLVLSRHNGRLIVVTPDGRSVWATADAAFTVGLAGADPAATADNDGSTSFVGVHPIDEVVGRRPTGAPPVGRDGPSGRPPGRALRRRPGSPRPPGPRRPQRAARPAERRPGRPTAIGRAPSPRPVRGAVGLGRVLFPDGEPTLPDGLQERYDHMDLRFAIGVLMGNRDLVRRLAAEARVPVAG